MLNDIVVGLIHSLGVLTLLSFFYGSIKRGALPEVAKKALIGVIMGCGAVFAMSAPTTLADGLQVDGRTVFVGVSAAFGGPLPALITGALAGGYRLWLGGLGASAGTLGIAMTVAIGLAWHYWVPEAKYGNLQKLAVLGLALPLSFLAVLTLPLDLAQRLIATVLPVLIPYYLVSTVIFGTLLHRERRLVYTENELKKAANNDFLTGLLNRRAFTSRLHVAKPASDARQLGTLVVLDIDHFKSINDSLGHAAGDAALAQFANLLKHMCRETDLVSRLGGEEFGIYMAGASAEQAEAALNRLLMSIRDLPIDVHGTTISVTASAGAHEYILGETPFEEALLEADKALYRAKAEGRDRAVISVATDRAA